MNSTASSARVIPPSPTTGIVTAFEASYTIRTAIGLIAGPESPPVKFAIRDRLVSTSMDKATNVFTSETASAPASCAAFAIVAMLVTFGDSFTISGLVATDLHHPTRSPSTSLSVPKTIPPWLVFGQLAFSSYIAIPSASFNTRITSLQSSTVNPNTFAITTVPSLRNRGIFSATNARAPIF